MDLGIRNKTALVLGASGGLGGAIAIALAKEGANVAVAGTKAAALGNRVDEIASIGGKAIPLVWDLGDLSLIDPRVRAVEEAFGAVDILINNTGGPPPTTAAGQDPAVWMKHFQAMVLSVIALTDRVLPAMRARKWGRIITSTTAGVVAPIPNLAISNTLRSSLVGWSKTLSREVAAEGITCNIVVPGRIETPRITFLDEQKAAREGKTLAQVSAENLVSIPMKRLGRPEEYADMVAFLASECAGYITGSVIRVDGGMIPSV